MDIRKIIGIILAAALAVVLFILIRSDRGTTPAAQADATPITQTETTPFAAETEAPDEVPHYHIAVLSSSELAHYPLVRIDLEGLEVPVYACTDAEGKVCFFVYGFEEVSGQYGFLPASLQGLDRRGIRLSGARAGVGQRRSRAALLSRR